MDVNTFIANLNDLASRYKAWWYPSFEKFRQDYSKEYPDYTNYFKATKEFETNLRAQSDLIGEIYDFIDENDVVYLNATAQECEEIRKTVTNYLYTDGKGYTTRFLEDLFFRYTRERAIPQLQETGDEVWLTRGLVAMSIENSGMDYRDSILALSDLRKIAVKNYINPGPEFERVAQISSNETPRGGSTPMRQLMAKIKDTK